jgi:hypothetical protein
MLKHLDSCIQSLKEMLGDSSNELGSEQQRALKSKIRKLKRLKKQPNCNREELYRIANETAEEVLKVL